MISSPLLCMAVINGSKMSTGGCSWIQHQWSSWTQTPLWAAEKWLQAPPKISFDNKAHVTEPLQLEGTSDLLVVRHSLCVYRPEVGGQQTLQEERLPLQEEPWILSPLSLLRESTRKRVQTRSVIINHRVIRQDSTLECIIPKIPSVSFPNWFFATTVNEMLLEIMDWCQSEGIVFTCTFVPAWVSETFSAPFQFAFLTMR